MPGPRLAQCLILLAAAASPATALSDDEARERAIRRMLDERPLSGAPAPAGAEAEVVDDAPLDTLLGALSADGPATPEQVSLYLPVTGRLSTKTSASVRYRTGGGPWVQAHPMFRIRPEFAPKAGLAPAAFAGIVTGLAPGREYQIEVSLHRGEQLATRTLQAATRALPGPAPAATRTVNPGDGGARIQKLLDAAAAGDVILFRNGTYNVDELTVKRSGSESRPIYIRGESRDGVKLVDPTNRVLYLVNASNLVIEDLTLQGSGADSGTVASSRGVQIWNGYEAQRITLRRLRIVGVDQGIVGSGSMAGLLVYDNTLVGNNVFRKDILESNASWNDDGIRVPGRGHAVFNNTLSGFGDALAMADGVENASVHFYRNRILFTCDDAFEGDYGTRNVSFHDNRIQNAMTLASFDPIYSGPAFVFRNVAINIGRQPYKLNNQNTGLFFYNNTVVRTVGFRGGVTWGWVQNNNGPLRAWGYRTNILVFSGGERPLALESGGNDPIDFDHNAWYPDGQIWWTGSGGSFPSLAAAKAGLRATTPVFGDSTRRHDHDLIAEKNPFETEIRFNASYDIPVTAIYEPKLAAGSVLKNAGVEIPGVTDGFAGAGPDLGAVIAGRPPVQAGDRTP